MKRPATPAAAADQTTARRSAVSHRRKPPAKLVRPAGEVAAAERMLSLLRAGSDARGDKIDRVGHSVRARTYENDLKLSIAVDRLTRDLPPG